MEIRFIGHVSMKWTEGKSVSGQCDGSQPFSITIKKNIHLRLHCQLIIHFYVQFERPPQSSTACAAWVGEFLRSPGGLRMSALVRSDNKLLYALSLEGSLLALKSPLVFSSTSFEYLLPITGANDDEMENRCGEQSSSHNSLKLREHNSLWTWRSGSRMRSLKWKCRQEASQAQWRQKKNVMLSIW